MVDPEGVELALHVAAAEAQDRRPPASRSTTPASLGHTPGPVQGEDQHARAQPDAGGPGGHRGQERELLGEETVLDRVVLKQTAASPRPLARTASSRRSA